MLKPICKAPPTLLVATGLIVLIVAIGAAASYMRPAESAESFKQSLPGLLAKSVRDPKAFVIRNLAQRLGTLTDSGHTVCAHEEITAAQYVDLSDVSRKLRGYSTVTRELADLLSTDRGVTDCEFRVLDSATRQE